METILIDDSSQIKRKKKILEEKLNVKITVKKESITLEGDPIKEYEAKLIIDSIAFGFPVDSALTLKDEEIMFRTLHIKDFTRRKNLHEVRARVIGTNGRTRKTLEDISNCEIMIKENTVGIIGTAENIEEATQAITNLIRGSKQSNVYRFLERMNTLKRSRK